MTAIELSAGTLLAIALIFLIQTFAFCVAVWFLWRVTVKAQASEQRTLTCVLALSSEPSAQRLAGYRAAKEGAMSDKEHATIEGARNGVQRELAQ